MMKLGLTDGERGAYERALRSSHVRRITVAVTNLAGTELARLDPVLLDGQVTVDLDAEVTRSATLSFLDPAHALSFDTDSPDDGALYADRMVRVDYGVLVEELGREVVATVFHGPVTKLDRAGDVVSVEAQGKETLASGAVWRTLTLKKGQTVSDAIRTLLVDRAGETSVDIPQIRNNAGKPVRMPRARSLDRFQSIWSHAKRLATAQHRQLFYDGSGRAILRSWPRRSVYKFRTGTGGDVVGDVQVAYQIGDVKNAVVVEGGKPRGAQRKVRAQAVAPANHPLSPRRLGRTGAPRYLVEVISDDSIRSERAAKRKAKSVLDNRLREVVEVTFDALPVPHLDPGDVVGIETDDFTTTFRLRKFTIPLTSTGAPVMSVGYLKKTTPNRRRIRT